MARPAVDRANGECFIVIAILRDTCRAAAGG